MQRFIFLLIAVCAFSFAIQAQSNITTPYNENFDSYGVVDYVTNPILPTGWSKISTTSNRPCLRSIASAPSQPNALYLYAGSAGGHCTAIMPKLDPSVNVSTLLMTLSIYALKTNDTIYVGVMSDSTNIATFQSVKFFTGSTMTSWTTQTVDFSTYTGTGRFIAFRTKYVAASSNAGGYGYVDNVLLNQASELITNLNATLVGRDVLLTWNAPTSNPPTAYTITEADNVWTSTATTFTVLNPLNGTHVYTVSASEVVPPISQIIEVLNCELDDVSGVTVAFAEDCSAATISWNGISGPDAATGEIYDNGSLITHPGAGPRGMDVSRNNISATTGYNSTTTVRRADNFFLPSQTTIDSIKLYSYQTGNMNNSTITGAYIRIWRGRPNFPLESDSPIVWGDITVNVMTNTYFTNILRNSVSGAITDTTRKIMAVVSAINTTLEAGEYWIEFYVTGSTTSGPWIPMVPHWGQAFEIGNSIFFNNSAPVRLLDGTVFNGYYDVPFTIYGSRGNFVPKYDLYRDNVLLAANVVGNSYLDNSFDNTTAHVWSVKTACDCNVISDIYQANICIPDGIEELEESEYSIYPNPASTQVTIVGENISKVEIFNSFGQLLHVQTSNINHLDVTSYASGIYFLKVYNNNQVAATKRLIIAK